MNACGGEGVTLQVIPIVIGALGTIPNEFVKGLEDLERRGQVETIESTALLRSARILSSVLETCGNFQSLRTPVLGNKRMCGDHPNYRIIEIGQNTEKSPGDFQSLAITQTLLKKKSLADVKNSQRNNNNDYNLYP